MLDRLYLPVLALAAVAAVALARSGRRATATARPRRSARRPIQRTPAMQAAMQRATAAAQRRADQARAAVRELQPRRSRRNETAQ